MQWDNAPYILVLMICAAITATLTVYMWERRSVLGAVPFACFLLTTGVWALAQAVELIVSDPAAKTFWYHIKSIGMFSSPVFWLIFASQYTGRVNWLKKYQLALLFLLPVVGMLIHGVAFIMAGSSASNQPGSLDIAAVIEVWFWIITVYSLALLLLGSVWMLQSLRMSVLWDTRVTIPVVIGLCFPWVGAAQQYYAYLTNPSVLLIPVAFTISGCALAWGIFRFGLLDMAPIARSAVVENLEDGVIIYDHREKVVDTNQAFARLLGKDQKDLYGQSIRHVLSMFPQLGERYTLTEPTQIEADLDVSEDEQKSFDIRLTPLYGARHKVVRNLVVLRDITGYRRSEQELTRSHALLLATLEATADGILVITGKGKPLRYNQRFLDIWRIPEAFASTADEKALMTNILEQLVNPAAFYRLINKLATQPDADTYDVLELKDNRVFERYSRPLRVGDLRVGRVWSFRDITEQRRSADKLRFLSTHDILTGLYNRVYYEEEINRLENSRQFPISMIMIDVDDLKRTNDTLGHQAGDALLRKAAEVLRQACRSEDMVARIGGDEFGIILPYSNEIVAENAVERIQNMSGMARVGDAELMLSVSIGYATAHTGESLRKVLRQADKAMYQVKESKHNRRMQPGMAGEDTPES